MTTHSILFIIAIVLTLGSNRLSDAAVITGPINTLTTVTLDDVTIAPSGSFSVSKTPNQVIYEPMFPYRRAADIDSGRYTLSAFTWDSQQPWYNSATEMPGNFFYVLSDYEYTQYVDLIFNPPIHAFVCRAIFISSMTWMETYDEKDQRISYMPLNSMTQSDPPTNYCEYVGQSSRTIKNKKIRDQGFTPGIPANCPAPLARIMQMCWKTEPTERPDIEQICELLKSYD